METDTCADQELQEANASSSNISKSLEEDEPVPDSTNRSTSCVQAINKENWKTEKEECDRVFGRLNPVDQKRFIRVITEARRQHVRNKTRQRTNVVTISEAFRKSAKVVQERAGAARGACGPKPDANQTKGLEKYLAEKVQECTRNESV